MNRAVVAGCLALCACAGSMVRAPREIPSDGVVECTDSMETPITAAVVGVVALGAAIFAVSYDAKGSVDSGGVVWLPVAAIGGTTALFSAAEGAAYARECRDAKRRATSTKLHASDEAAVRSSRP